MLKQLLEMKTKALYDYLINVLEKEFELQTFNDGENYIFYQSCSNPLCLVAHIDTVREEKKKIKIEQKNNIIRNKYGVLGADDRAGVYTILELMYKCKRQGLPYPSILFTNYEESGGIGVKCFIDDLAKNPFENTTLFIELDRGNANEYVYYSWDLPKKVKTYIESFGFVEAHGSYSDIADLTESTLIPGINLSVGFYNQHTKKERLHVDELQLTIARVFKMLKNPLAQLFPIDDEFELYNWYEEEQPEDRLYLESDNPFFHEDFERPYQRENLLVTSKTGRGY